MGGAHAVPGHGGLLLAPVHSRLRPGRDCGRVDCLQCPVPVRGSTAFSGMVASMATYMPFEKGGRCFDLSVHGLSLCHANGYMWCCTIQTPGCLLSPPLAMQDILACAWAEPLHVGGLCRLVRVGGHRRHIGHHARCVLLCLYAKEREQTPIVPSRSSSTIMCTDK